MNCPDKCYGNQQWSILDILSKLCEATSILLDEKDYDGDGWEQIKEARDEALKVLEIERRKV